MHSTHTLSQILIQDLQSFIAAQKHRCQTRVRETVSQERIATYFQWGEAFATRYLQSRNLRAQDLQSPEIAEARNLSRALLSDTITEFFATCVDGRNMPTVMFSKAPHVGGVLRAPAGTVTGFLPGQTLDSVYIDHESFVVQRTKQLLQEHPERTILYGLDSHIGCAARGLMHETEGGTQQDGGVRSDIVNKLMTAKGIRQLRNELHTQQLQVSNVIPHFFSFDPHSGGLWMGLEACIADPQVIQEGFTASVLAKLAKEHRVITTLDLLNDSAVQDQLSAQLAAGTANFRTEYRTAILRNWHAISALYANGTGALFVQLQQRVSEMYTNAGWHVAATDDLDAHAISEIAIAHKAKLLLKNLVTRYSIAGTNNEWPFDQHQEEMVVITDGGHAPYPELDAFAVFSRDLNALVPNTKLTIDIIRNSRKQQKIHNSITQIPLDLSAFVSAPVLITNKAIVAHISEADWQQLETLSLEELFARLDWDSAQTLHMRKSALTALLLKAVQKHAITVAMATTLQFIDGVYELFERLQIMMRDKQFRLMLLSGSIIVINTLIDDNRQPRKLLQITV